MTYTNVNSFIVIEADNRDPDTSFKNHRKRGSYGGVDCVAPLGTPIYAPDDCNLVNFPDNGTGGNTIRLRYMSSAIDEMMHLSSFVNSGYKNKGELVGYSGDTGSPEQPHVHWHRLGEWRNDEFGSTNRYNPFHYFETESQLEIKDNTMRAIANRETNERAIIGEFSYQVHLPGDQISHEAHIWETLPGSAVANGEPLVVDAETYNLAIGQVQKRRAEFLALFGIAI